MARSTVSSRRSQRQDAPAPTPKPVSVTITLNAEAAALMDGLCRYYDMGLTELLQRELADAIAADVDCVWGRIVHSRNKWLTIAVA